MKEEREELERGSVMIKSANHVKTINKKKAVSVISDSVEESSIISSSNQQYSALSSSEDEEHEDKESTVSNYA